MAIKGKRDRYWEMREGGPYDGENANQIFKCTDCGAETHHPKGWNGEPDPHLCTADCRRDHGDWRPGGARPVYKKNFDRIFPNAPGAGL